ncbi:MAG: hypothetical protein GX381_02265 [Synergistaceae bacterium]|nr:hypothetical protein [Synergistaceae bacterium]
MKRPWVSVLIALLVVLIGSSAFAFYGLAPRHMWDGWSPGPAHMWGGYGWYEDEDSGPQRGFKRLPYKYEVPTEIAQKMRELERAKLDLRYLFLEDEIDKEKAKQIHEKILSLRTEISRWQFEQWLTNAPRWQQEKSPNKQ